MQVLIIPSWYFHPGSGQIQGRMFHQHASALREDGIDARIFFAGLNFFTPFNRILTYNIEEGVPTWRASQWYLPKIHQAITKAWAGRYAQLILKTFGGDLPDLLHAQSYLAGIVASEIKKRTGVPFIITERLSAFITGEIQNHYKRLIQECFQSADMVTCVSPGLRVHLRNYSNAPIRVIPNFFDPDLFYPDPAVEKFIPFTWVSVGEPAGIKGLDHLMQAYCHLRKKFPDKRMQLIMIDEIKEKHALLRIANRNGCAEEIIWKGLIPQKELANVLRKSHALISASRVETFGKAIVEAQACGLPVVATRTDGAQFIIQDAGQGSLVEIDNVDDLSAAMATLFETYENFDPTRIRDAIMMFSKSTVIRSWIAAYNEVLES